MLPRVVRILSQAVSPVVVVAAEVQDLPPLPTTVTVVRDDAADRGPLQGLAAGLSALQSKVDAAFVSSCDVPLLRPEFVQRMIDLLGDRAICVPEIDGVCHPLAAVYRTHVLASVRNLLQENRLRLGTLIDELPTRIVHAEELVDVDPAFQSLRNVNTPEDYEQLMRELPPQTANDV